MNICIPIDDDCGLKSEISLGFASAKHFLVIDPATAGLRVLDNQDTSPHADVADAVALLSRHGVTHVVVAGVGPDALMALRESGMAVFTTDREAVDEILDAFKAGRVTPVTLDEPCKRPGGTRGFNGPHGCGGGQGGCCDPG
jgi:predicted Fe-Mo cluster-binding NifX family protein